MPSPEIATDCPQYRVRIFLSVDLSNSTSYKSQRAPHQWVPTFRDFYSEFSDLFRRNHIFEIEELGESVSRLRERKPNLWKTVGDEIIFVNRVDSCFEVSLFVKAFAKSLQEYNSILREDGDRSSLSVKGSAWIASFPYPNITIAIPTLSDPSDNSDITETEQIELSADESPNRHEFLGKGLDYGFRIAKNAADDFFVISPALAGILIRANVNEKFKKDYDSLKLPIVLREPVHFKGVLNGSRYPVLGVPVDRDEHWGRLRKLESELLSRSAGDDNKLQQYLRDFIALHEVEEPSLKIRPNEPDEPVPDYYTSKYVPNWKGAAQEVQEQDAFIEDSSADDESSEPPTETETARILARLSRDT